MTYYNYLCEMQQLCFRAREALKVLEDNILRIFYALAEEGFFSQLERLPVEKAKQDVNLSLIESFIRTKRYVEEKELDAAYKIKREMDQKEASHE